MSIEQKVKQLLEGVEGDTQVAEQADDLTAPASTEVADEPVVQAETIPSISEDIAALVAGEELTEEFKAKAATIFEAAVLSRVKVEATRLQEEFDAKLAEQVEALKESLIDEVDGYLGVMAEQWMQDNELALESGLRTEMTESFIEKLKDVFVESYIDVPQERLDVVSQMEETVEEISGKLDESTKAVEALTAELNGIKKTAMVKEAAEGLSDVQKEKFVSLAEEISFESAEAFASKIKVIRESYFAKPSTEPQVVIESVVTDAPVIDTSAVVVKEEISPAMSRYLAAIK